jgi:hypothetical protein
MTNGAQASEEAEQAKTVSPAYDLEERTAIFSERVIDFAVEIERNPVTLPLISQLVRAATRLCLKTG